MKKQTDVKAPKQHSIQSAEKDNKTNKTSESLSQP